MEGHFSCNKSSLFAVLLCVFVLIECFIVSVEGQRVVYEFVRYTFRKKPKLERQYKIGLRKCEQTDECRQQQGLDLVRCGRVCLASACYQELYGRDELELGEIDVRLSSFKGCWAKKFNYRPQ